MRNTLGNIIQETKEFINNAMELKRRKENKFIDMNNEMLEVLRLEEEAKAKIEVLKKGSGVNA
ncbi:hypothetical protein [Clostridium perfringens]|uniref:hypothetical protein n=1 Tax=Clostridium perfringens TaxID=1502 RepID=UPI0039ED83A5